MIISSWAFLILTARRVVSGCLFCIAAVVIALMTLDRSFLPPILIFSFVAASIFPSLIGGF